MVRTGSTGPSEPTPSSGAPTQQANAKKGTVTGAWPLHLGLLMLAFSSGAMDAFAFLSLGGIFTGMMTGNLILVGMFSRPEFAHTLIGAATAIIFFVVGAFIGFNALKARTGSVTRPHWIVPRVLVPSLVAQASAVVVWWVIPSPLPTAAQYVVVALLALALSLQTVGAKKASDIMGITTTYVTGTLTTTMQEFVESRGRGNLLRVLSVLSLPLGAISATALLVVAHWSVLLLPLAVSAAATVALSRSARA